MAANVGKVLLKGKGKVMVKGVPSGSSQLGKFLGVPNPPRSHSTAKLISNFIKINTQNRAGMKKDPRCMEKLKVLLNGKDRVGTPEIAKLLSQQFVNSA
ncbi:hypothetical protein PTKIN_Ptkin04bG0241400 [Pterospermum kingtungense]